MRELDAIAPYFAPAHSAPLKNIYTQRRWLDLHGGGQLRRERPSTALAQLSPDYTDEEMSRIWQGNDFSEHLLLPHVLSLDLTAIQSWIALLSSSRDAPTST